MRWLTTPERMEEWILGARAVEANADGLRMTTGIGLAGTLHAQTFTGETLEYTARRLVRRYTLDRVRTGPIGVDAGGVYTRTVTYDLTPALAGCELACTVVSEIDGLPKAAIGPATKAEARSLQRSLDRLRLGVEGKRAGAWRRSRDSSQSPQPL